VPAPVKLYLASSNQGKLNEFRVLAAAKAQRSVAIDLRLLPAYDSLPAFDEDAPTFAENAAGKALHYSRLYDGFVFADDSGLVVPSLGGRPGVHSARYVGPTATNTDRIEKLLAELKGKTGNGRRAYFVCAIALAEQGRAKAVVTGRVDGEILQAPRGAGGFGYDPIFYFPPLQKSFAELSAAEKNEHSHRGKAFRRLLASIESLLQS
jgi:XTP/dITP diphosphohydrolase